MLQLKGLGVNENGNLTIGGMDTTELVKQYKTPLYVMDEQVIRENCRLYMNAMKKHYDGMGKILYASKALSCKMIYQIVEEEGLGIDVVSGGELYTALSVGFPADRIYFHGNNKTEDEIGYAVDSGIQCFVVDNRYELNTLNAIAKEKGKTVNVSFRIKPGIDAHTHDYVMTGQIDSKFGVGLKNGEAHRFAKEILDLSHVKWIGIHCHIGSQIFGIEPFMEAVSRLLGFLYEIKMKYGEEVAELNLGGGYGVKYTDEDDPIDYEEYIKAVSQKVKEICSEKGLALPYIIMEPGRTIVASAGITLYTVGGKKEIEGTRTYVSIDGGMTDNLRYALYEAKYDMVIANKGGLPKDEVVTIAGKCCESGDLLGKDVKVQKVDVGDTLAVLTTGAYNYSMANHYNRTPKPAMILVDEGKAQVMIKRESYDDLIRNDVEYRKGK